MTSPFTPAEARNAFALLSSPGLIRLITEIDQNGPIPRRRLASTLPDLSAHQLRRTTDTARAHALVRISPGIGLALTMAGAELADVYDATARWARRHAYPARFCDITSRIQHTARLLECILLADPAEGTQRCSASAELPGAEADLPGLHVLLDQWLNSTPQVASSLSPLRE